MATALDIISRALRSINVLGVGETADAAMAADALDTLNDVLEGWDNEGLTFYQSTQEHFPLTSAANYTIGPGGDFDTVRPMRINYVFVRWNGVDYPVGQVTLEEYDRIPLKTVTSNLPNSLYEDVGFPLTTLKLWPAPNTSGLVLYIETLKPLISFANLTSVASMPPGYNRALRYALATELMPEYGANNPQIVQMAADAKGWIKRQNFKPSIMQVDGSIPMQRGGYNIYADI